ncbi:cysteine desulfurase [Pseudoclavibacter chungangensis]|uniref:Cysteine desulfurase n=1 Tax=Pseudoclavibacter chungangensis TaxID=587635 RepID=A0A7J5BYX1_9MICO|nr:cysteine desulfurase family protein [Pseudoclavibacter chungangensis]KAB1659557.1 cysteine desulfurase [Pseudoclavibacter chungangensis]NYJ67372.1 cysteine desulfurase [Pseudoclavibacter chungangensis]
MTVYLDHAATTPMRPEARAAYLDALALVGNPASIHGHGQAAKRVLENARERVAEALDCDPIEVVWTSGGTESINLAIKGAYWAARGARPAVVTSAGEHHATLDTVEWLVEHAGARARSVGLDGEGRVRLDEFEAALADGLAAVASVLVVNNEVGAVQPVRGLAALAADAGVPLHLDAVSAFGHVPVSLRDTGVAAVSVSAHKIGGPVGIGALAVSRTASLEALVHGGGQQRGLRSGTQDVASAAAFAAAVDASVREAAAESSRLRELRDELVARVRTEVMGAVLRGPEPGATFDDAGTIVPARVDANAHFTFDGCQGDSLLFLLDLAGVSVSTGSACQAGVAEPSHVLRAMGLDERTSLGALRFTLGAGSTRADVDRLLAVLPDAVERARATGYSA